MISLQEIRIFNRPRTRLGLALTLFFMSVVTPSVSFAQRHGRPFSVPAKHKLVVLSVEGKIATPLYLSFADLRSLPRSTVNVVQGSGETWIYEGVALVDILRRAGAPFGSANKTELRTYVEAISRDEARAVFSLAEIDPSFLGSNIVIADTLNGTPFGGVLPKLCLIAGTDKQPGRSIQNLATIRVRRVR